MKRTTLTLVILALGLGGFVYFDEIRRKNQPEQIAQNHLNQINKGNQQNQSNKQQIFSFAADDVQSLSIRTKDYTLNLERSQKLEAPKWLIKLPTSPKPEPAKDAIVSYLTDLLVKGKSESSVSIRPNQLGEFGLDQPQATIDIQLKNKENHKLILGRPNFNDTFLYAQVNPNNNNNENAQVLLVSKDFANAVNRDLSEWEEASKESDQDSDEKSAKPANQNTQSQPLPGLPDPNPADTK